MAENCRQSMEARPRRTRGREIGRAGLGRRDRRPLRRQQGQGEVTQGMVRDVTESRVVEERRGCRRRSRRIAGGKERPTLATVRGCEACQPAFKHRTRARHRHPNKLLDLLARLAYSYRAIWSPVCTSLSSSASPPPCSWQVRAPSPKSPNTVLIAIHLHRPECHLFDSCRSLTAQPQRRLSR